MGSVSSPNLRRLRKSKGKSLLDERRLEVIRRRIADGYYNRNEIRRSIAEKLVTSLGETESETQDTCQCKGTARKKH